MLRASLLTTLLTTGLVASTLAVVAAPAGAQTTPSLDVTTFVDDLDRPWGLDFTPDGTLLFTERAGAIGVRRPNGTVRELAASLDDLFVGSETGLMGLVVDPDFADNRRFYTCQGHRSPDEIQVIAWRVDGAYTTATRVRDPLVGGIPRTTGRHGGCALAFDRSGHLRITTGDAADGTNPQDLTSLGGKTLRVVAASGAGAADNPFAGSSNADTRRVFTFGHRNPQGISVRPGNGQVWIAEHGPGRDDEVNLLVAGANYGWAPGPGYDESVPMTDLDAFPDAVEARWSSGAPTIAVSGAEFLAGDAWGAWEGALAVATLKDQSLRIMRIVGNAVVGVDTPSRLDGTEGRLRTPRLGPDGALYITTDSPRGRILRVAPQAAAAPFGAFDEVEVQGRSAAVRGWAIDDDTTGPVEIRFTADGADVGATATGKPRPDVDAAFPGRGGNHGWSTTLRLPVGVGTLCAEALDVPTGEPAILGCRTLSAAPPFGALDEAIATDDGALVRGWAIDDNVRSPVRIHIYVDGVGAGTTLTGRSRPDVDAAFPGRGGNHGYVRTVDAAAGQTVCTYAIDDSSPTRNRLLGCRVVANALPFGAFDELTPVPGGTQVRGWAIDASTTDPIGIHVYVDGVGAGITATGLPRPDVNAVFDRPGDHGYLRTVPAAPGQEVCVYAIDAPTAAANPLLGCKTVPG